MSTAQLTDRTPSTVDREAAQLVTRQYGCCTVHPEFFDDFYKEFTSQSPEILAAFAKTDMKAQKEALRSGLAFLIMYASGNQFAGSKLDRIGKSHSRAQLNIRPDLYPLWLESLIRTVKKHVESFDRESETAWRRVLQLGVERIKGWY